MNDCKEHYAEMYETRMGNAPCPWCQFSKLWEEFKTVRQETGNVLAAIHRDGGHYISDNGLHKACRDAIDIVLKERTQLSIAKKALEFLSSVSESTDKFVNDYARTALREMEEKK